MNKVNIGLYGIFIIIALIIGLNFHYNSKLDKLFEEVAVIKSFLEDIDDDIREIDKRDLK